MDSRVTPLISFGIGSAVSYANVPAAIQMKRMRYLGITALFTILIQLALLRGVIYFGDKVLFYSPTWEFRIEQLYTLYLDLKPKTKGKGSRLSLASEVYFPWPSFRSSQLYCRDDGIL